MKNTSILVLMLFLNIAGNAQTDTTPPYLKTRRLPDFSLLSLDSALFTQTVLQEGKNTIIMLFNPDCEHCHKQTELFISMPEVIQQAQLILVSTETLDKIKFFYTRFKLYKYRGLFIGKDYKYFFGGHYRPKTIPVLAFYNKQKQLTYFSQGNVSKKQVLKAIKK
jgi:thiol-disulfide isomerase/thioredoxin